jgi:mannose-6-phosphate isomerase-like protein (cupin superfamily)
MNTKLLNVYDLPLAANVCDQMLREIPGTPDAWTMAHVIMNPGAESLLHKHEKMSEVYAITHGNGELICDDEIIPVQAGNVVLIWPHTSHKLVNTGVTSLEHLVLASPRFDPNDVIMVEDKHSGVVAPRPLGKPIECFDGALIIPYRFDSIHTSFAIGQVVSDPKRHKRPHYHKTFTEYIYILEGQGAVEINGEPISVARGDWVKIDPGEFHAIRNSDAQHLVALCICNPAFILGDVHFD